MALLPILILSLNLIAPQVESQADFDRRMETMFAESKLPGVVVRVVKDGKPVYGKAFGVADVDKKTPSRESMAFEIGSLSKQFTAVAALMLVQEGKLSLEETVGTIMPELPAKWQTATVDQVMHHTSGIPDYEAIATYDFYNQPRQPKEIFEQARKEEPAFKPGDRFDYSNTGYFIISLIVEKRGGMPFGQFLRKRIFDPIGMKSTYADVRASGANPMTGYHSRTGNRVAQPPIAWSSTLGAGGVVSTLDDLTKWDEALYTDKLVKKDLLAKIWTPSKFNDGKTNAYGYGWIETSFRGVKELNHSGQTNGFTCIYRRFPDLHCSVWAFTNTYDGGGSFRMAKSALVRCLPSLSYATLPTPTDPDPERTKKHMLALRQALYGGADLSMLSDGMREFATGTRTAETRKEVQKILEVSDLFKFVRVAPRKTPSGVQIEDFLYRQVRPKGSKHWTLSFSGGLMAGLFVEDE
jgi:D-alanyl-D-alanine carboxypeptidase